MEPRGPSSLKVGRLAYRPPISRFFSDPSFFNTTMEPILVIITTTHEGLAPGKISLYGVRTADHVAIFDANGHARVPVDVALAATDTPGYFPLNDAEKAKIDAFKASLTDTVTKQVGTGPIVRLLIPELAGVVNIVAGDNSMVRFDDFGEARCGQITAETFLEFYTNAVIEPLEAPAPVVPTPVVPTPIVPEVPAIVAPILVASAVVPPVVDALQNASVNEVKDEISTESEEESVDAEGVDVEGDAEAGDEDASTEEASAQTEVVADAVVAPAPKTAARKATTKATPAK
jgi:hypothetical protein